MTEPGYDRAALEARNAAMREQVDGLLDQFNQQTRRLQEAQAAAAASTATVTSQDGLVTATVDSSGSLVDLAFAAASFQRSDPSRLARTATETVRRAAAQVRQQVADLMAPVTEGMPDLSDIVEGAPSLRGLLPKAPDPPAQPQEEPPEQAQPGASGQATSGQPSTSGQLGAPSHQGGSGSHESASGRPARPRNDPGEDDDDQPQSWLLPGGGR